MNGWVKLHRAISDWEWFKDSQIVHLFLYLIISANHEDNFWMGKKITKGQFVTSRINIARATGISEMSVRTILKKLEKSGEINKVPTNKFSIITICKYDDYQNPEELTNQQLTNKNGKINQQLTNKKPPIPQQQQDNPQIPFEPLTQNQPTKTEKLTTNKNKIDNIPPISPYGWRDDFKIYLRDCIAEYRKWTTDPAFMGMQQHLNPSINIGLSIEKGFTNFWGTEAGWHHKKKSKIKTIDWKSTIINSIDMNKVYLTKQEMAEK